MRIRRRMGEKGQIIIPEIIREYIGIKPGDDVFMEVREGELVITPGVNSEEFVNRFCSVVKRKLAKRIDFEKLIEKISLHNLIA
ncbi:MAG: AbrB/MazE/SpoVT family DNA-binding domain-containing protein [Candidatus Bathyarchaeia archaeon]|nr:AbrB/MazE/SpoVT family DNA-binding domain-containing protein [Candidatus Bathyarchaeota archaeon]